MISTASCCDVRLLMVATCIIITSIHLSEIGVGAMTPPESGNSKRTTPVTGNDFKASTVRPLNKAKSNKTVTKAKSHPSNQLQMTSTQPMATPPRLEPEIDISINYTNLLFESIIKNYRKELLPTRPMIVKLDLLLVKVKNTIEREGIFESVIALFMEWHDKRLVWNPAMFGNISVLTFKPNTVWIPDVAMLNSADHQYAITRDNNFVVRLQSNGTMKYVPMGISRSWCHLRLVTFPFDIQTCSFEFESWSLDHTFQRFANASEALVDEFMVSPQWTLCEHRTTVYEYAYNLTSEGQVDIFSRIRFDFVVRRKSTFYIVNLIFPCTTVSLIQLLVFTLPSKETIPDRVGFGIVNILTLVIFQTMITEEMPKSSDAITALTDYIIALILTSAAGILESVIAERMLRLEKSPPNRFAYKLLSKLPKLWTPHEPKQPTGSGSKESANNNKIISSLKESNRGSRIVKKVTIGEPTVIPRISITSMKGERPSILINRRPSTTSNNGQTTWLAMAVDQPQPAVLLKKTDQELRRRFSFVEVCGSKVVSFVPLPSIADEEEFQASVLDNNKPSEEFSVKRGRKSSIFARSTSIPDIVLGMRLARMRNNRRWALVVNRIDSLLFLVYAPFVILLPVALFLPLIMVEDECSRQDHSHERGN